MPKVHIQLWNLQMEFKHNHQAWPQLANYMLSPDHLLEAVKPFKNMILHYEAHVIMIINY